MVTLIMLSMALHLRMLFLHLFEKLKSVIPITSRDWILTQGAALVRWSIACMMRNWWSEIAGRSSGTRKLLLMPWFLFFKYLIVAHRDEIKNTRDKFFFNRIDNTSFSFEDLNNFQDSNFHDLNQLWLESKGQFLLSLQLIRR